MKLKYRIRIRTVAMALLVSWGLTSRGADVEPTSLDEALRAGNINDVLKILGPGESDSTAEDRQAPAAPTGGEKRHRITLVSGDGTVRDLSRTPPEERPRAARPADSSMPPSVMSTNTNGPGAARGDTAAAPSTRQPRRALPTAQPVQVPLTRPRESTRPVVAAQEPKPAAPDEKPRVTTVSLPAAGAAAAPEDRELASKELATLLKSMRTPEPANEVSEQKPAAATDSAAGASVPVLDEDRKISKPLGVVARTTPAPAPRTSVTVVNPSGITTSAAPAAGAVPDPMQSTRHQVDRLLQEAKAETFGSGAPGPAADKRVIAKVDGGWRYEGRWVEGRMDGDGVLTYPDGWRFDGEWREGVMMGQGTLVHPDGWQYTGEWRNGRMDGHGALTYPDGWKYVGEWRDGKMHGKGELIHPRNVVSTPGR